METNNNFKMGSDTSWQKAVLKYAHPDLKKSIWQVFDSVVPYLVVLYLMYRSLVYPYWVTLLLSLFAAGFLIRIFIIFHDCGHRSFFISKRANNIVGSVMGILAFTPYNSWHDQHWVHHVTSGNLDKRGIGDVWTMTVEEYRKASKWERFSYRVFRNPFIMFTLGPILVILMKNRITRKQMSRKAKRNIVFTNIMLLFTAFSVTMIIGLKAYLLIQIPVIVIAHSIGIWLFYIQHQFDDTTWERDGSWDYSTSAVNASSFLKLPAILQWFTGNIGFHHIHHLSPKIPNYNLEKCHYENEMFKAVKPIIFFSTFRALKLGLWDEANKRMVSFRKIAVA
jgi:acyl-lipid omega-6 desaturase (Delta-12 desaturase)